MIANVKMLRDDVKSLMTKASHVITDEETKDIVCDLLSVVRYILKSQAGSPVAQAPRLKSYDQDDDELDEDISIALIDPSEARERSKRNLKDQWSGPLPDVKHRTKKVGVNIDSSGKSGPEPGDYGVAQGHPSSICRDCNGPIGSHPVDRNAPVDANGDKPRIACDSTRVYCGRVD